jgi:bleomycin hydrolase
MCILSNIISEGGSGNTGYRLVKRYGIVPYNIMPSTEQTFNPGHLVDHITKILKIGASRIRIGEDYSKIIKQTLRIVKKFLCVSLGSPPSRFSHAFPLKTDGKFFAIPEISPIGFYRKYLKPFDSQNLYVLINTRHPIHKWVATKDFESTTDTSLEDSAEFVITPDEFETTLRNSIKKHYTVYIGIDVDADINTDQGWGEVNLYDPNIILNEDEKDFMNISKKELLNNDMLSSNHAVLIVGYGTEDNKEDGIITHWLIENSWGEESGDGGYLRVSREWLLENAYGACIQKRFLPRGVYESPTKENMIIVECYEGRGKLL